MSRGRDEHDPEGQPDAGLDSLFGEQQFRDYEDGVLGNPFVAPPGQVQGEPSQPGLGSAGGAAPPAQPPVTPQAPAFPAAVAQPPASHLASSSPAGEPAAPLSRREAREAEARRQQGLGAAPGDGVGVAPHAGAHASGQGQGQGQGANEGPGATAFGSANAAPGHPAPVTADDGAPGSSQPEWQSLHDQPEWEPTTAAAAPRRGERDGRKFSPYLFWFGLTGMQKALVVAAGVLLLVIVLVGLYAFGAGLAGSQSAVPPAEEPGGDPVPVAGPLEPGDHAWNALQGGECLSPFDTVWAESFTVVDCGVEHPAQLLARGLIGSEVVEYQDAAGWQALLPTYCNSSLLDLSAAGEYTDLQFEFSYPGDATEWGNGGRDFFCFVTRSSGESLTGSLAPAE